MFIILVCFSIIGYLYSSFCIQQDNTILENVPVFSGNAYTEIDDGIPGFSKRDKASEYIWERYSKLDALGRCGAAYAVICKESMPEEEKSYIGDIKPSGWHTVKYNNRIDGNYLYNRCHLIGYQLAGESANERNLITGTRYLNVIGMLPFENAIAEYVNTTYNHVLYRVTPVYDGENLVASGVQMEGWSLEDQGEGICFNVFCYNVQPGVIIDYATGDSHEDPDYVVQDQSSDGEEEIQDRSAADDEERQIPDENFSGYILNTNTYKIHLPDCSSVDDMKEKNKKYYSGTIEDAKLEGYTPCHNCLKDADI